MSLSNAICLLTCGAILSMGCQEQDASSALPKKLDDGRDVSAAEPRALPQKLPLSEGPSDRHSARPLPVEESRYPQGPERPTPTIQLEPLDMMTAVGNSPLHVLVSKLTSPDASELLQRVAAAVKLRTWPELEEVPTTAVKSIERSDSSELVGYAHVYLQPNEPLVDRWYALAMDSLPSGVKLPDFASVHTTAQGQKVARFRVGSQPEVTGLRVYTKTSQEQVVYVDVSERVVGNPLGVVVTGPAGKCQGVASPRPAKTGGFPAKGDGAGEVVPTESEVSTTSIQLACSGKVEVTTDLTLEIKSAFRSTSGPALHAGKAGKLTLPARDWSDWGGHGKQLRVPAL